jgi:uncharacterized protein (UPF0332 family)
VSSAIFMKKARKDLAAANILLSEGLAEAVCNRAYYAMHNAARASLFHVGEDRAADSKTHSGLLSAFSLYVVKTGFVETRWSSVIAQEERRRLLADYEADTITVADAENAVVNAKSFVEAIAVFLAEKA